MAENYGCSSGIKCPERPKSSRRAASLSGSRHIMSDFVIDSRYIIFSANGLFL